MSVERPSLLLRLGRESFFAALAGASLALLLLRARPAWTHAVIGGGDAWQNLWNLHHVDRVLRTGGSLWQTDRLWAPEGCSLYAHTLSLTNSLPGALLARATGFFAAYNALVVLAFTLAFASLYRLARRLGAGPLSAAAGAAVFAFAPPHFARALGHLNLLGTGWIPLSLEALFVASRSAGAKRWGAAVLAGAALAALAFTDWYLALLGALAAACFAVLEIVRAGRGQRAVRAAAFGLAAALSLAACFPAVRSLARAASSGTGGHEPKWCSTALTSLVVPSRIQLASALTPALTERNHQNLAEGAGYLGLVPLLALLVILRDRRRRDIDFALLAGGIALVLSLGPQPRVFDRLLDVPLPWAGLARIFPALDFGGCVNRFEVLAFLPLALATALASERLLARGTRDRQGHRPRGRAISRGRIRAARPGRDGVAVRGRRSRAHGHCPRETGRRSHRGSRRRSGSRRAHPAAGSRQGADLRLPLARARDPARGAAKRSRHRPSPRSRPHEPGPEGRRRRVAQASVARRLRPRAGRVARARDSGAPRLRPDGI